MQFHDNHSSKCKINENQCNSMIIIHPSALNLWAECFFCDILLVLFVLLVLNAASQGPAQCFKIVGVLEERARKGGLHVYCYYYYY